MRLLEKGFGCCSLRISTIAVLLIHAVVYSFSVVYVLFNLDVIDKQYGISVPFGLKLATILTIGMLASVFSYSLWTVFQHNSSMLTVAIVLFCVNSYSVVTTIIITVGSPFPFSTVILTCIFGPAFAGFELYCAWILFSYKAQFSRPLH